MSPLTSIIKNNPMRRYLRIRRIAGEVLSPAPSDQPMKEMYSLFLRAGDLCFDVGANIGNRTKIFSELVGRQGRVIAIEPQSFCMSILQKAFGKRDNVHLIKTALGPQDGEAEINISNETTVSSMSKDWIAAVQKSKRFGSDTQWSQKEIVQVTTLDKLIARFGAPAFIKIDVEGFEKEVLQGLTKPFNTTLSIEFTPEYFQATFDCLDLLHKLGSITLNYSIGESMKLELKEWVQLEEFKQLLLKHANDLELFGDIYIKLRSD